MEHVYHTVAALVGIFCIGDSEHTHLFSFPFRQSRVVSTWITLVRFKKQNGRGGSQQVGGKITQKRERQYPWGDAGEQSGSPEAQNRAGKADHCTFPENCRNTPVRLSPRERQTAISSRRLCANR